MATLDSVSVNIAVVLGTTSMPIHQVLRLGRGVKDARERAYGAALRPGNARGRRGLVRV